jgi:hypothetical protein
VVGTETYWQPKPIFFFASKLSHRCISVGHSYICISYLIFNLRVVDACGRFLRKVGTKLPNCTASFPGPPIQQTNQCSLGRIHASHSGVYAEGSIWPVSKTRDGSCQSSLDHANDQNFVTTARNLAKRIYFIGSICINVVCVKTFGTRDPIRLIPIRHSSGTDWNSPAIC